MIFQEPMTSLNPVFGRRPGRRGARLHEQLGAPRDAQGARSSCSRASDPRAGARSTSYPHELSGGMKQRVMIAMAIACGRAPDRRRADDGARRDDPGADPRPAARARATAARHAILLITHDLGVVASIADRVAVMYAGEVVEEAPRERALPRAAPPLHAALLRVVPRAPARRAGSPRSRAPCRRRARCRPAAASTRAAPRRSRAAASAPPAATPTPTAPRLCAAGARRGSVTSSIARGAALRLRPPQLVPGPRGPAAGPVAWVRAVDGRELRRSARGETLRAGRRVGLRQDDGRAARCCASSSRPRARPLRRPRPRRSSRAPSCAPCAARCRSSSRTRTRSLNPRIASRDIVGEALETFGDRRATRERTDRVAALLERVGLPART